MRGAILITISQFISRLLGAIYRPVGQVFIGDQGLALVTPPNAAYFVIMAISSIGLNVAISRLISERLAVEDYRGARRVFNVATGMLVVSGAVFALLFALGARWLAAVQGFPEAWPGFLVLSPAIFLVTLLCAFRGLYQGMQQMQPSAVSQVVESIGRVGIGLILVAVLSPIALNYGAAGFNAGSTIGVALSAVYAGWVFFRDRPTAGWTTTAPGIESLEQSSITTLIGKILAIAIPLSLIGTVMPLMQAVDSAVVINRMTAIGTEASVAKEALAHLMNAGTLRDLPSILTNALYISLVPAVTESMATGRLDQARNRTATAFRVTLLIGLPATAGLLVGARDTYGVFFTGPGYAVMGPLAWSTIFLMIQQTSAGALQGMGLIWVSVRSLLVGVVLKTVLTYWWTGIPSLQANGAAYATGAAFAVAAGLNLWSLWRSMGFSIRLSSLVRPLAASAVMGVALRLVSPLIHQVIPANRIAGLAVIGVGALVYLVAIFLLGGITTADMGLIPGVRPGMIAFLKKYRLLRE